MSCSDGFSGNNVTARCTGVNKWSHKTPTCIGKMFILAIYKSLIVESMFNKIKYSTMEIYHTLLNETVVCRDHSRQA